MRTTSIQQRRGERSKLIYNEMPSDVRRHDDAFLLLFIHPLLLLALLSVLAFVYYLFSYVYIVLSDVEVLPPLALPLAWNDWDFVLSGIATLVTGLLLLLPASALRARDYWQGKLGIILAWINLMVSLAVIGLFALASLGAAARVWSRGVSSNRYSSNNRRIF